MLIEVDANERESESERARRGSGRAISMHPNPEIAKLRRVGGGGGVRKPQRGSQPSDERDDDRYNPDEGHGRGQEVDRGQSDRRMESLG